MKRRIFLYTVFAILCLRPPSWGYNLTYGDVAGSSISGDENACFGSYSCYDVFSQSNNVNFGWNTEACGAVSNSGYNVAVGAVSLYGAFKTVNCSGGQITAIGYQTGLQSDLAGSAAQDVFVGNSAGMWNSGGDNNTFVGNMAGQVTTTGGINTFIGHNAGNANDTGIRNIYIGNSTASSNVSGHNNIFIGDHAGGNETGSYRLYIDVSSTTAPLIYGEFDNRKLVINGSLEATGGIITDSGESTNTFLGDSAGATITTGTGNTFVGSGSGNNDTTGSGNTYIGYNAGDGSNGSSNVFIGKYAGAFTSGSNRLYVSIVAGINPAPLIYGEFDNRLVQINGTLVMSSDERLKKNIEPLRESLDNVMKLRGVSYEWKNSKGDRGFGGQKEIGFIAQEVEKVLPELVHTDSRGFKAVAYNKLAPVLIEAVKERQATVVEQRKKLADLDSLIEKLEKTVEARQEKITAVGQALSELTAQIAGMEIPVYRTALNRSVPEVSKKRIQPE